MTCEACPFGCSERTEMALNLGCLPTPQEIMTIKLETGKNWSCHEDENRICSGFVQMSKIEGVNYKEGELASYSKWYHTGNP